MFEQCYKDVPMKFYGCFKDVLRLLLCFFKCALRLFHGYFKGVDQLSCTKLESLMKHSFVIKK